MEDKPEKTERAEQPANTAAGYTPEQIERWKKESPNGEIYRFEFKGQEYVFIAPSRQTYKRFVDSVSRSLYGAQMQVLMDCMKYPSREAFNSQLDRYPQLVVALMGPLSEAVGLDEQAQIKNV